MLMNSPGRRWVGTTQDRGPRIIDVATPAKSQSRTQQQRAKPWRCVFMLCSTLVLILALTPHLEASFVGIYALNNFTLTNVNDVVQANTHGSAVSLDGGLS